MTPAINLAKKKKIKHTVHEYSHDSNAIGNGESYGQEAADKMGMRQNKYLKHWSLCSKLKNWW